MLEVGKHRAPRRQMLLYSLPHRLTLIRRIVRLAKAVVVKVCGRHFGRGPLLGLGHAQSCTMFAQRSVRLLVEPRRVAELEGRLQASRQEPQEFAQYLKIYFKV